MADTTSLYNAFQPPELSAHGSRWEFYEVTEMCQLSMQSAA